jgi:hypothetical protein
MAANSAVCGLTEFDGQRAGLSWVGDDVITRVVRHR